MKYIATTSFSQGNKNILNTPDGGMHIERGRVVELPFEPPVTKLPKDEYLKYSVLFGQQPYLVPLHSDEGKRIQAEVAAAAKADKRRRAWPIEKWCMVIGIILAALTFVWGVFVWLKPGR